MIGYPEGHKKSKELLGLWNDASVQKELERVKWTKEAFVRIANEMEMATSGHGSSIK